MNRPAPGEAGAATHERSRSLARAFEADFGQAAEGVWAAPGRVNLIGEHTDYNAGLALPFAIDERALVAVRRRADDRLQLVSRQSGRAELLLSSSGPGHVSGWAAYVAGVVWAAMSDGADATGLDVLLDSDVPMGAGLSSSAAVECATLAAIAELWGMQRSPLQLAQLAQRAEREVAGVPCGLMDQLASLCGRPGHALSIDFCSHELEPVPFVLAGARLELWVVDTRAPHQLAEGAYAERRESCTAAAERLGVPSLREATAESLFRLESEPVLLRRARHVLTENARVVQSLALLRAAAEPGAAARLGELGPLLSAAHASLRDDFEVTVPELDVAAEQAERAGALGARMFGGGFGGSVLALLRAGEAPLICTAVEAAYSARGWQPPRFFQAHPSGGAGRVL